MGIDVAATELNEHDSNLYRSLRDVSDGRVRALSLRDAIENTGLELEEDKRLEDFRAALDAYEGNAILRGEAFTALMRAGGRLVSRALRGELAIPDFHRFRQKVQDIYEDIAKIDPVGADVGEPSEPPRLAVFDDGYNSAKNADYIPQLADEVPDGWGAAICTVDGQVCTVGAGCKESFSIQSCCKPFNYCDALEKFNSCNGRMGMEGGNEGPKAKTERIEAKVEARKQQDFDEIIRQEKELGVHDFIDSEASGQPFNAPSYNEFGMPINPLVNTGAIMCSALLLGGKAVDVRFRKTENLWKELVGFKGPPPSMSGGVNDGEERTGNNNRHLAFQMAANEAFPSLVKTVEDVNGALKFYFHCCALMLTAEQMSIAAGTLANRGVCPTTGDRVFRSSTVKNGLAAMLHCGMYDSSGRFGRLVGLPAKSGVGGGILVVVPGVMGICTFSPRLDKIGNSLRGLRFYEKLLEAYALHMLEEPDLLGDRKLDVTVPFLRSHTLAIEEVVSAASRGDVDAIRTVEHHAGSEDNFRTLLNKPDYDGRTPLHLAAEEGHESMVKHLLDKGADSSPRDRWAGSALDDARRAGHQGVVGMIEKAVKGTDDDASGESGLSKAAAARGQQLRASIDAQHAPMIASTPELLEVIWASAEGDLITLRRQVAKGARLHIRDYDDRTPLHLAAAQGQIGIVRFLVNYHVSRCSAIKNPEGKKVALDARISWPDRWGRTPLDEVVEPLFLADTTQDEKEKIRRGQEECREVLVQASASAAQTLAKTVD